MKYSVIVVDPPWSYGSDTKRKRTAEFHYKTIGNSGKEINRNTGEGIENIITITPVVQLADNNAHLYLWATNPKLPFAFEIMNRWGFVYKTTLSWVKVSKFGKLHSGGMGWFFRGATEHVLFGVKGNKSIPSNLRKPNVFFAQPRKHSEKPIEFYNLLRTIYPEDEKMIDMYARQKREGFFTWGDQAPDSILIEK